LNRQEWLVLWRACRERWAAYTAEAHRIQRRLLDEGEDQIWASGQELVECWRADFGHVFGDRAPFGATRSMGEMAAGIIRGLDPPREIPVTVAWASCAIEARAPDEATAAWIRERREQIETALRQEGVCHELLVRAAAEEEESEESELRKFWRVAKEQLQLQMTGATYDTWIRNTELVEREEGRFVVSVTSSYAKDWLENRMDRVVRRTLEQVSGGPAEVVYVVRDAGEAARQEVV
jgi:hypothetical protein